MNMYTHIYPFIQLSVAFLHVILCVRACVLVCVRVCIVFGEPVSMSVYAQMYWMCVLFWVKTLYLSHGICANTCACSMPTYTFVTNTCNIPATEIILEQTIWGFVHSAGTKNQFLHSTNDFTSLFSKNLVVQIYRWFYFSSTGPKSTMICYEVGFIAASRRSEKCNCDDSAMDVLQCAAMCCNVLQCVAMCCSMCCGVLYFVAEMLLWILRHMGWLRSVASIKL